MIRMEHPGILKQILQLGGVFCLSLLMPEWAESSIVHVPEDSLTIRSAVSGAAEGDTILVSPGTYYENINLGVKNVVLASHFLLTRDTGYIRTTIINGSTPNHPDTASCILIIGGQDSTTIVQGFTITGGQGTAWKDEHSSGTYREGGGILVALSSPVIRDNLIEANDAINKTGITGAGGGGIRCGDGHAHILNNVIIGNNGKYGGGLVFNYCNATIRNNIIAYNSGGEDYGGGGLWINGAGPALAPNMVENNTIIGNHSVTDGGGVLIYNSNSKAILTGNIVYGNTGNTAPQISVRSGSVPVTYCDIQGGWNGSGNLDSLPSFMQAMLYLEDTSPCIDAGDPESVFNDTADPLNTDSALFPSKGSIRNDIGAYGGPGAGLFPSFAYSRIGVNRSTVNFGSNNTIGVAVSRTVAIVNQSTGDSRIDSVIVEGNDGSLVITYTPQIVVHPSQSDSIVIAWTPADDQQYSNTLLIYHSAEDIVNPLRLTVTGKALSNMSMEEFSPGQKIVVYPNPFSDYTVFHFPPGENISQLVITDINGAIVTCCENPCTDYTFQNNNLKPGVYLFNAVSEGDYLSGKIVITE